MLYYYETITQERSVRFCPVIRKNVTIDINEKSSFGSTITHIKCCNENQCSKLFGKCKNKVIQGLYF